MAVSFSELQNSLLKTWVTSATSYFDITDEIVKEFIKIFPTRELYSMHEKFVCGYILDILAIEADKNYVGLGKDMRQDVALAYLWKGVKTLCDVALETRKRGATVMGRVKRLYHKLGEEIFNRFIFVNAENIDGYNEDEINEFVTQLGDVSASHNKRISRDTDVSNATGKLNHHGDIIAENLAVRADLDEKDKEYRQAFKKSRVDEDEDSTSGLTSVVKNITLKSDADDMDMMDEISILTEDGVIRTYLGGRTSGGGMKQDLYETPVSCIAPVLTLLESKIPNFKNMVFFEPYYGRGAISTALMDAGVEKIINRDLYTLQEKQDYLSTDDPPYDILITNPNWSGKYEFLEKVFIYKIYLLYCNN